MEKPGLVQREVSSISWIEFNIPDWGKGTVVVNVALKMPDMLDVFGDLADERDEGDVDVIRTSAAETIAPINIFAISVCDNLLEHPHGIHWDVMVCFSYVGFMHVEFDVISVFSSIRSK